MTIEAQKKRILAYLKSGNPITKFKAFTLFNCTKADTRISELRREGYPISDRWIKTKHSRFKEYFLLENE